MAYLTPLSTSANLICWRVFIPNDVNAKAAFLGQLLELSNYWNWEQDTGVSIQDTIDMFNLVYESLEIGCNTMIGSIVHFATSTPPDNVLLCDGSIYNRVDYPDLYDALLPAYIVDIDTFQVPDLRDKMLLSAGTSHAVGETGGEDTHTLTVNEIPPHQHGYSYPSFNVEFRTTGVPDLNALYNPPIVQQTLSTGGGEAHNNLPPYVALQSGIIAK